MKRFKFPNIKSIIALILAVASAAGVASCGSDGPNPDPDPDPVPSEFSRTLIVYMPWSTNLTYLLKTNVEDIEESFKNNAKAGERLVVYFATSASEAELYEVKKSGSEIKHKTIKTYSNSGVNTAQGVEKVLSDAREATLTYEYGLIVGCHGLGWVPKQAGSRAKGSTPLYHWDMKEGPVTRFFGGLDAQYQINIEEFAQGVKKAGIWFNFILFDNCYMANIETAYELREITKYMLASTSEVMGIGMPYSTMLRHLLGKPNYEQAVNAFYMFYSSYSDPYGTIALIDCEATPKLADAMLELNDRYEFDENYRGSLQKLDGYTPAVFYDFGDYVCKLTGSTTLPENIAAALNEVVVAKANTPYYYSSFTGKLKIYSFSGLTISDPSTNSMAITAKHSTQWWKATHKQ